MKASQILKGALESHYVQQAHFLRPVTEPKVSEYMCHAVQYYLATLADLEAFEGFELERKTLATFMPTIESENTICLVKYLLNSSRMYRFRYDCSDLGHSSKACFNLRVKWWKKLIAKLEAEGN